MPLVGGEVDERRVVAADPHVGEARVDLPEGVDGGSERRLDLRLVPDVTLQGQHLGAVPAELFGGGLVLGLVGAPDRDVGPLRRQPVGHSEPDATVAAGHQGHVPGQIEQISHARRPYPGAEVGQTARSARSNVRG